jgi:Spy/CpxP family protein refolding chaperone
MNMPIRTLSPSRSRRWAAAGIAALAFGTLSAAGISYANDANMPAGQHHRMGMRGPMDPARAEQHVQRMLERLVPDATPEQKTRISAIAKAAMTDLKPLHEQRRAAHQETMKLLSQPTLDRAAIEKSRQAETQIADRASKRMTQAWIDAAEVLTPAQRAKAAEQIGKHRKPQHKPD